MAVTWQRTSTAAAGADPELLALGQGLRAVGSFLLLGPGAVVPEPPLHDRRAVGRGPRRAVEHGGPRSGVVLGMRRAAHRTRDGDPPRRRPQPGRAVL